MKERVLMDEGQTVLPHHDMSGRPFMIISPSATQRHDRLDLLGEETRTTEIHQHRPYDDHEVEDLHRIQFNSLPSGTLTYSDSVPLSALRCQP